MTQAQLENAKRKATLRMARTMRRAADELQDHPNPAMTGMGEIIRTMAFALTELGWPGMDQVITSWKGLRKAWEAQEGTEQVCRWINETIRIMEQMQVTMAALEARVP